MSRKEELAEKGKLEKLLCNNSINRTVSQALIDIRKVSDVCLEDKKIIGSELKPLAEYKDGMAFVKEEGTRNWDGTNYTYILHRNGENMMYVLDRITVSHK